MATTDEPLIVQRQGRVCTFTINRPDKLNFAYIKLRPSRLEEGGTSLEQEVARAVIWERPEEAIA